MSSEICFVCQSKPVSVEVQLSKLVLGERDPLTVFFAFGPHFKSVQSLKAALRVHVRVQDLRG